MPLKIRKLAERSEGTTETKSAIRSKMSERTRTSKAIKGTRRSDRAKETERRKGSKEAEGAKQGGKISFAAIPNGCEWMRMYESPFQFGLFFSVSIPKKVSN
jgi:hypothetical protein